MPAQVVKGTYVGSLVGDMSQLPARLDDEGIHGCRGRPASRLKATVAARDSHELHADGQMNAVGPARRRRRSPGSATGPPSRRHRAQPLIKLKVRVKAPKALVPERRLLFAPAWARPGPTDLTSSLMVLASVAQDIAAAAAKAGLSLSTQPTHPGAVSGTWYLTSSYSGWGSAEMAAGQAQLHMAAAGMWVPNVISHSATDYKLHCRAALRSHKPETAPQHIMNDLLERIPASVRCKLTAEAAERRRVITNKFKESNLARGSKLALAERKKLVKSMGEEFVAIARRELAGVSFTRDLTCSCSRHPGRRCRPAPPAGQQNFWLEVAGTTCVAWSTMSTTSWGWLDESGLPCLVWCYWVLGTKPDAVAHEIVGGSYRPQVMIDILSPVFEASSIVSSPTFWGIPSHRTRRYSVFLRRCFLLHATSPALVVAASSPLPLPPDGDVQLSDAHDGEEASSNSCSNDHGLESADRSISSNCQQASAGDRPETQDEVGGQTPASSSSKDATHQGDEGDVRREDQLRAVTDEKVSSSSLPDKCQHQVSLDPRSSDGPLR